MGNGSKKENNLRRAGGASVNHAITVEERSMSTYIQNRKGHNTM